MEYLSVDKKWTFSLILKYFYQLLFWYCVLLCIPVCACAKSRAQKNAVNSFGKYFYVENIDNFTSGLIFLKRKGVIQSSRGSKKSGTMSIFSLFYNKISIGMSVLEIKPLKRAKCT